MGNSARTGWPGVNILWLGEMTRWPAVPFQSGSFLCRSKQARLEITSKWKGALNPNKELPSASVWCSVDWLRGLITPSPTARPHDSNFTVPCFRSLWSQSAVRLWISGKSSGKRDMNLFHYDFFTDLSVRVTTSTISNIFPLTMNQAQYLTCESEWKITKQKKNQKKKKPKKKTINERRSKCEEQENSGHA